MSEIVHALLSEAEARALTDEVKQDAQALWGKLLALYEGQAHLALGYSSWAAYYAQEFGQSKSRGYQLLDAARTVRGLEAHSTIVEWPGADNVHFSSETDEWATPQDTFDALHAEFGFELDVCAQPENAKCERYFTPEQDGLAQNWTGTCWMNPPYGRKIGRWMEKAWRSAQNGATVVCLVPARPGTAWWHDYCQRGEVRFLRGRLKFGDAKNSAPFSSAVVVFRPGDVGAVPAPPSNHRVPLPTNEHVVRRLAKTAERSEQRAFEIWHATVDKYGPDATAEQVSEVAAGVEGRRGLDKDAKRFLSAARKALRAEDPQAARRALAIWRAGVYPELDRIAKADGGSR